MLRSALLALVLATSAAAQVGAGHAVVIVDAGVSTMPRAQLVDVDVATGATRALPRFPFDDRAPEAVAIDPVNGDVVVALADPIGGGASVLRATFANGAFRRGRVIATVSAPVRDLAFGDAGDLVVAASGLLRTPRNGGAAHPIPGVGTVRALEAFALSGYGLAVEDTAAGPALSPLDLVSGMVSSGPHAIQGLGGAVVTGVHDLPTGAIRQVLTDDQGRVHLFEFLAQLRTLALTPPLPAGGTVAMRGDGLDVLALGGRAHPYLVRVVVFGTGAGSWQTLAGPLPGDPVDFAIAPPLAAEVLPFGRSCGGGNATWTGAPTIGNAAFALGVQGGPAASPVVLALGLDEQQLGALPLPWPVPGGCELLASAETVMPAMLDASGAASIGAPIPTSPSLTGARAFAQWFALPGALVASDALAVRIAP